MDDLILGPIIGGLSHERAFLWGKTEPQEGEAILHAWLGRKPDLSDAKLMGRSWPLSIEQGYAGVAPVSDLQPETTYHYHLTLSDQPPAGKSEEFASFTTFPQPGKPTSFNFAFGSCFRPESEDGGNMFNYLEERRIFDHLRFILLLGDQVYSDDLETNSIGKIAETLEEYRKVYEYVWSRPSFRKLLTNLPAFMTLDDHEVDDDWRWLDHSRRNAYIPIWDRVLRLLVQKRPWSEGHLSYHRVQAALQAYWEHQGMHAPSLEESLEIDQSGMYKLDLDRGSLAYSFEYGSTAFFVLDTRTMRVRPRWWKFSSKRTMLGEGQWENLKNWLLKVKDTHPVKFLISSCSLFYWSILDIPRDRWSGFKEERDQLLRFIAENEIEGLYILSGDLHVAHAIHAELKAPNGRLIPVWEFCSSPFEQKSSELMRRTRREIKSDVLVRQDLKFDIDANNFGVVCVSMKDQSEPKVSYKVFTADMRLILDTAA